MRIALLLFFLCVACGGTSPSVTEPEPSHGQNQVEGGGSDDDGLDASEPAMIPLGALNGGKTTFGDERGPVTVVAMWASYCAPCLRELHFIEALYQAYRDRDEVSVLLVSIDDFETESRAKVAGIVAEQAITAPAFIDYEQALIERLAPRDRSGKPYLAVPMVVVVDAEFGLRRELDISSNPSEEAFVATLSPLIEAAVQGEPPPPDEPYEAPLGGAFTQRNITLTVQNLEANQIDHYLANLRHQIAGMYPDLHGHQLDDVMAEVESKLSGGGTFRINIPAGHQGQH